MKRQRLNRHMLFPMLTVIMLLSASHICAQRNFSLFGKDVSVGVRAGITYSEISKSNYSDGKIGWLIGADLEIPVEKVFRKLLYPTLSSVPFQRGQMFQIE